MPEARGDEALVEEIRQGHTDACLVLWRRYSGECREVARSVATDPDGAERVLRSAFARVLREVADGTDPLASFRVHLRTTVVLEACSSVIGSSPVLRAFSAMCRLDQMLLWASLVDHATSPEIALLASVPPAEAAERVGAALSRLRARWVLEVLDAPRATSTCSWVTTCAERPRATRLGPVAARRYRRHAEACEDCRGFVEEVERFPENLRASLTRSRASSVPGESRCADD